MLIQTRPRTRMKRETQKNADSEKPESDATDVAAAAKAEVKEEKSDFNKKKKEKKNIRYSEERSCAAAFSICLPF